ncbi:EcsC family protein [Defluviimonas sp. WL0002]|uniref:EcsC family protein n=1 Tax=Albidovulum marisflavi TaxID=2984159 RepID=A0ABT2ZA49_9RHOB|nr:EcsC family protein [Defluviimonas sp. WL0002]MCV2868013.1 EcsC family protein [Defluviimonas sp. WL0002]
MTDDTPLTSPRLPMDAEAEIEALVKRAAKAHGPVIKALNSVGGSLESQAGALPDTFRRALDAGVVGLLENAYRAAGAVGAIPKLPEARDWTHRVAAAAGGALGGLGGLGSAMVELPATITLIFSAMQRAAAREGFDPASAEVRMLCLDIFGSGGPGRADDGVNTAFLGTRLSVNGVTLQTLIQRIAPGVAAILGRKLAGQAVPVLGAAAGAGINYAYMSYYEEMARVRFALKRLADTHGEDEVLTAWRSRALPLAKR